MKFAAFLALGVTTIISGCATVIKPTDLAMPESSTCVYLPEAISSTGKFGVGFTWTSKLERGPYVSEYMDEGGTYYRAPQGGYSVIGEKGEGFPGLGRTMDGGIYLPKDASMAPTIYRYSSVGDVPAVVPPQDADCGTAVLIRDPVSAKVDVMSFAVEGTVGGAVGGVIGRSVTPKSSLSYGQAASTGAAGGLIGGVLIATLINAEVGKIVRAPVIQDAVFLEKLKDLHLKVVPVRQAQASISQ